MLCEIMKGKSRRPTHDLRLKIAIIESRQSQRRIAFATRIGETRLSEIVGHRGSPPTEAEKHRLGKHLGRPVTELFPDSVATAPKDKTATVPRRRRKSMTPQGGDDTQSAA